jgi:hypothetical protein
MVTGIYLFQFASILVPCPFDNSQLILIPTSNPLRHIPNPQSSINNLQTKIPMSPPSSHRKRGAPPGNHNAIKHGFYSKKFEES